MGFATTTDLWWKQAVLYCLDVETFADGNGDGIGDFIGLTRRIDHLASLGVTCIWLMPFYPTPNSDDGYDVSDHYAIDPRLGTFGDFAEFMAAADDRGMRVIADLVVNHTSSEHPWFQAARRSADSPFRSFYVWRDERPDDGPVGLVFPGEQAEIWTYDTEAQQYYLHRFYRHQPDLNIAHAPLRDEIHKVIGFWLRQGLAGFRVDAVPFFLELDGIAHDGDHDLDLDPHDYLRDLRARLNRRVGDAVLLGEVNLEPQQAREFFGDEDGDELHMLFNFIAMQYMYLALARGEAAPLVDALRTLPELPDESQWASFVRNHDELTLDKLTDDERVEVFEAFGPDPDMQIFDRGLRRRLPPMLDGDRRRIEMVYSLMFSLPGTPTLFYGEEIGMGENLVIDGRLAVRTPMQWTGGPAGGFTSAPADALRRPLPDGDFGPDQVNVADQETDPGSLLNWFRRLIRTRRACPEIGHGVVEYLDVDDAAVIAAVARWDTGTVVTVHHLAGRRVEVEIDLPDGIERAHDLLHAGGLKVDDGAIRLDLAPYDHRWLRLS
jgi:trehalose synthase